MSQQTFSCLLNGTVTLNLYFASCAEQAVGQRTKTVVVWKIGCSMNFLQAFLISVLCISEQCAHACHMPWHVHSPARVHEPSTEHICMLSHSNIVYCIGNWLVVKGLYVGPDNNDFCIKNRGISDITRKILRYHFPPRWCSEYPPNLLTSGKSVSPNTTILHFFLLHFFVTRVSDL